LFKSCAVLLGVVQVENLCLPYLIGIPPMTMGELWSSFSQSLLFIILNLICLLISCILYIIRYSWCAKWSLEICVWYKTIWIWILMNIWQVGRSYEGYTPRLKKNCAKLFLSELHQISTNDTAL